MQGVSSPRLLTPVPRLYCTEAVDDLHPSAHVHIEHVHILADHMTLSIP
jgi:hypothetical protein